MRFSIREGMIYMALTAALLAMTRLPVILGAPLIAVLMLGGTILSPGPWRAVAVGALYGCLLAVLVGWLPMSGLRHHLSVEYRRLLGLNEVGPFVLPLGTWIGGTMGWAIVRTRANRLEREQRQRDERHRRWAEEDRAFEAKRADR